MIADVGQTHVALEAIRIDGGTQPRAELNQEVVGEYAQRMLEGTVFPALTLFYDGRQYWLADGFHRYHAYRQICRETVGVEINRGTRRDAVLYSVGANDSHGIRRTNADKRRSVETLLRDEEWGKWSDREIARQCRVDHKTVGKVREELSGEIPQIERSVERNGTVYTMNTAPIGQQQSLPKGLDTLFPGWQLEQREQEHQLSQKQRFDAIDAGILDVEIEEEMEEPYEQTEEDRYMTAIDTGTLDIYYDDLRRDAIARDREQRASKSATLTALQSSESNEWYTPQQYVEAARALMGGIDVDPASNASVNEQVVRATTYYDIETDGLAQVWTGRIFLNPPYGRDGGESNQEIWSHRLIEQYECGDVSEAVLLVNANTEAKWFQPLYRYPICFTNHRIRFYNQQGESSQPTQGNAFVYFGAKEKEFIAIFKQFGVIVRRVDE